MQATLDVARIALRRAMEVRKKLAIPMDHAVSAIDLAQQMGIEVWFKPLASLSGMYSGSSDPVIVIGSDRPAGYQASTCAHEIGHHVFDHGTRVDEYIDGARRGREDDAEEMLANLFGAHLLMPHAAVARIFAARMWSIASPTPAQVFIAAGHLGVGYQTLVHHLRWTIRSIVQSTFDTLRRFRVKAIRESITGRETPENVLVVDEFWVERPVDMVVGDIAILPPRARCEGSAIEIVGKTKNRTVIRACRKGLARAETPDTEWSSFIRVMHGCYDGAGVYRHLEDPDEP